MPFKSVNGGNSGDGLNRFVNGVKGNIPDARLRAALILEGNWKQILLTPGTGRQYGKHRASAPGMPPAPNFGELQRSITHEPDGSRVGTNAERAEALEFGTTTAGKNHNVAIAPRPAARPAYAASKDAMTDAVVATLKRGNRRGN